MLQCGCRLSAAFCSFVIFRSALTLASALWLGAKGEVVAATTLRTPVASFKLKTQIRHLTLNSNTGFTHRHRNHINLLTLPNKRTQLTLLLHRPRLTPQPNNPQSQTATRPPQPKHYQLKQLSKFSKTEHHQPINNKKQKSKQENAKASS